eukprot:c5965_g1_i1.p1 GENE.c5965_g1_i1~~c5965_g1_i1.p1  ORF type:complete len:589 (-),score=99.37 c5965_g1_i1:105-1871(-)
MGELHRREKNHTTKKFLPLFPKMELSHLDPGASPSGHSQSITQTSAASHLSAYNPFKSLLCFPVPVDYLFDAHRGRAAVVVAMTIVFLRFIVPEFLDFQFSYCKDEFGIRNPTCNGDSITNQNDYKDVVHKDVILVFGVLLSLISSSHWHSWVMSIPGLGLLLYYLTLIIQDIMFCGKCQDDHSNTSSSSSSHCVELALKSCRDRPQMTQTVTVITIYALVATLGVLILFDFRILFRGVWHLFRMPQLNLTQGVLSLLDITSIDTSNNNSQQPFLTPLDWTDQFMFQTRFLTAIVIGMGMVFITAGYILEYMINTDLEYLKEKDDWKQFSNALDAIKPSVFASLPLAVLFVAGCIAATVRQYSKNAKDLIRALQRDQMNFGKTFSNRFSVSSSTPRTVPLNEELEILDRIYQKHLFSASPFIGDYVACIFIGFVLCLLFFFCIVFLLFCKSTYLFLGTHWKWVVVLFVPKLLLLTLELCVYPYWSLDSKTITDYPRTFITLDCLLTILGFFAGLCTSVWRACGVIVVKALIAVLRPDKPAVFHVMDGAHHSYCALLKTYELKMKMRLKREMILLATRQSFHGIVTNLD